MVHTDQTRITQNGKQSSRTNTIAEIEVLIRRQQQLAAKLARHDHNHGEARAARNKLFGTPEISLIGCKKANHKPKG